MTYDLNRLAKIAGFHDVVPPFGYRWGYFEAFSEDYQYGITIIAFIGSVFSPFHARRAVLGLIGDAGGLRLRARTGCPAIWTAVFPAR